MTGYSLTKQYFKWALENPELNTPSHTALYMWCIEKWNTFGKSNKFSLPSSEAMAAVGIKSYTTYIKTLTDLISWGFVVMVQKSKNQFTANVIALTDELPGELTTEVTGEVPPELPTELSNIGRADIPESSAITTELPKSVTSPVTSPTPLINKENRDIKNTSLHANDRLKQSYDGFNQWLKSEAPEVLQMKKPITLGEYTATVKRITDKEFTKGQMQDVLRAMGNAVSLKKYVSAYRTMLSWIAYRKEHGTHKESSPPNTVKVQDINIPKKLG